jgi:two-component system, cell cycle response regulator
MAGAHPESGCAAEATVSIHDPTKFEELKASGRLPSPKGVAVAILRLSQRDDVTSHDLAHLVKTDPAFAGRLIKAANSIGAGGRRPVVAVSDAIMRLGIPAVTQLALGFSLVTGYRAGNCEAFDYDGFWSRSLLAAIAMQAMTLQTGVAPPEETFTCGLLSRIGSLALATLYPAEYSKIIREVEAAPAGTADIAALERQAFALDHAELSAAQLADWGIPKIFIEPVLHHEQPNHNEFAAGSRGQVLTDSLLVASELALMCTAEESARPEMLVKVAGLCHRIGVDADTLNTIADRVVAEWQEWGNLLSVPTRKLPPFAEIAADPATLAAAPAATPATTPAGTAAPTQENKGNTCLRLLVVDDDHSTVMYLQRLLQAQGYEVHVACNGRDGLELALDIHPHIVITDWVMPEMDGIALTRALRNSRFGRSMYILVLTTVDDEAKLVEAFDAGADDFLAKPPRPRVLEARLGAGRRVIQLRRELEEDREEIRGFASGLAVTNRRLREAAMLDPLTEFPNRRYAMERLDQEWASALRNSRPLACMVIDVDSFKHVNDRYGHAAGDAVLQKTAEVLKQSARAHDVICRIGGDEFLVICPDTEGSAALQCGERLCRAVAATEVEYSSHRFNGSVSVGIAARDDGMPDPKAMMRAADHAMYQAKHAGRNRARVHRPGNPDPGSAGGA